MSWLEQKYVGLLSPRLEKFKRSGSAFTFRCPICGDSQKNKNKTRGYLFSTNKGFVMKCHNCGISMSFVKLMEQLDPMLFSEYKIEFLKESGGMNRTLVQEVKVTPKAKISNKTLTKLSSLEYGHEAVSYVRSRHIPESKLSRIGYTENLKEYVVDVLGATKYKDRNLPQDRRIVFEMRNAIGDLIGFQARAIGIVDQKYRFITIKLDDDAPKIYGLDSVNLKEYPVFVTEGIIDSLFLPNCLALCGGDVAALPSVLRGVPKQNVFVCLDNEPRHKDTISRMKSAIDLGYNVMFWDFDSSLKDINDMIKSGITTRDILASIKKNSKRGASAILKLSQWKMVQERKV